MVVCALHVIRYELLAGEDKKGIFYMFYSWVAFFSGRNIVIICVFII